MADLKEYTYTINGMPTTGMLSEDDAERLGAVAVSAKAAPAGPAPVTKGREVDNAARQSTNKHH